MSLPPCWSSCAEALPLTWTRWGPESSGCAEDDEAAAWLGWVEQAARTLEKTRAASAARASRTGIEGDSWGTEGRRDSASFGEGVATPITRRDWYDYMQYRGSPGSWDASPGHGEGHQQDQRALVAGGRLGELPRGRRADAAVPAAAHREVPIGPGRKRPLRNRVGGAVVPVRAARHQAWSRAIGGDLVVVGIIGIERLHHALGLPVVRGVAVIAVV